MDDAEPGKEGEREWQEVSEGRWRHRNLSQRDKKCFREESARMKGKQTLETKRTRGKFWPLSSFNFFL